VAARVLWGALALAAFAGFGALGIWQIERRAWKLDLIARAESRVHAEAVAPPWSDFDAANDEYRRVRATGVFLNDKSVETEAVTALGGGFWVITPLQTPRGIILINRGFVPGEHRDAADHPAGAVTVTGLLRLTEPKGGFLRGNDPAAERWYSRDVAAIAAAEGLGAVAPYFIDADATPNPGGYPVGGLTVIAFPNNHLMYALTWFGLAALVAGSLVHATRKP
jgi:surfeit locus 1 family protein